MSHLFDKRLAYSLMVVAMFSLVGCMTTAKQRDARRQRDDGAPKVGDVAPSFKLQMLRDEGTTVELAAFRDKKPVVLFFGSYT